MTNVVLVHGLWVDGSSWTEVTGRLQEEGHVVTAVQLPLSSLEDDVAAVQRALAQVDGPSVLVGHSYGGMVISNAAAGGQNVAALVYLAAVAPEEGEAAGEILGRFPASPGLEAVVADAEGYVSLDRTKFAEVFAADVPAAKAAVMAASQGPAAGSCLAAPSGVPAWKSIPSTYVVCTQDRTLQPEAQQWMAERIGARIVHVDASHSAAASQPAQVVDAIVQASRS
ncbi:alpha/beta hydrolase [Kitasatospora sp. NPDC048540]|uniref:alpha/beta fold hydrolase n=1 Tax=unclassified Kitasatospora TaxID=2633591 RepID=UPI00053A21CB|nr:alpha/beta hydrolase [Kitasatospora sp. MBT63]